MRITAMIPFPAQHPMRHFNTRAVIRTILFSILVIGAGLRCYSLSARSFWFDEAFTWRMIQFPFQEMIRRVGCDNSPPLYFICLKVWATVFGESAFALRSFSVLLGILTILGGYLFLVEGIGNKPLTRVPNPELLGKGYGAGLFAAALIALSAFQIRYSWEARMYALATALTVFSSLALFRALHPPSRLWSWLLYGLLILLLIYTHYFGLFTLVAQEIFIAVFLLKRSGWKLSLFLRDRSLWHAFLVTVLVIVCWSPWFPIFLLQLSQVRSNYWSFPLSRWDVAELSYQMFVMPEAFPAPSRQQLLIVADFCILGLWLLWRKGDTLVWYLLWCGASPLLFSLVLAAPSTLRYFVMAHLLLIMGVAALIWRLQSKFVRAVAVVTLLFCSAGGYLQFWQRLDIFHKPGVQAASALLQKQKTFGEPVIVSWPLFYFSLVFYSPDHRDYYLYTDSLFFPHHYGTAALTATDLVTAEDLHFIDSKRVWVVDIANGSSGVHSVPIPSMWIAKSHHVFTDIVRLGDVIVVEYEIVHRDK